jgi:hypothetical protein
MDLRPWNSATTLDPGFASAWRERLARSAHAHFAMDLRFLEWEARHGRGSLAVLAEDGERRAALVMREEGVACVSGWPWRWGAVLEAPEAPAAGLSPADCDWFFGLASRVAGARRLRCYLPVAGGGSATGYLAGSTLMRSLGHDDDEFLRAMDGDKRRAVKRARREGFEVVRATTHDEFKAFARLQRETERRRGTSSAEIDDELPAPGESWREWEHPWMMLLLVVRGGVVEAGSGYGIHPGGLVDYRANASTPEGKKLGGNALLAFEALRHGRELGCRWMNWGGATTFKRDLGGERVDLYGRLGGGVVWALPNQVSLTIHRARPQLGAWWRTLKAGIAARRDKGEPNAT